MTAVIGTEGGRWVRVLLYLVTITTGLWGAAWPSATLVDMLNPVVAGGFGLLLAAAGLSCLYGTVRGSWVGEHVGLPFAVVGSGGFAILLCWTIGDSLGRGTVAGLAIMTTILLADRWRGVRILARMAREDARAPRHP